MNDAIFEDIDADSNHFQIGNDFHLDLAERYYDSDWMIRFFNESDYRNSTMNSSLTHLNIIRSISSNIDEFMAYLAAFEMYFDAIHGNRILTIRNHRSS